MHQTPDSVCAAYAEKKVKLTIRALEDDENTILIEGEAAALEFLGQLLLAQATFPDGGFHLGPDRAGKALFSKESTKGIYLHRLPCQHGADGA
jgi:hypothetical protein